MFSLPVRMGLNPAPNSINAPTRPQMDICPLSGFISPLSNFSKVLLPAPLRPINPKHSPRFSSKLTSFTAQNSFLRSCPSSLYDRHKSSLPRSFMPYQRERLRSRQNFLETFSTFIKVSLMSVTNFYLRAHTLDQDRHRCTINNPHHQQQCDNQSIDQKKNEPRYSDENPLNQSLL